ncbi:MAG: zinc ribbon domain-containing protein [Promethearchaeota archaeon]
MIYHDYFSHMMDIGFESWIFMILCAGAILLLIIAFAYLYNHYINISKSRNQLKDNIINNDRGNPYIPDFKESIKANFCHNCGQKLYDKDVKFCPYCGERI